MRGCRNKLTAEQYAWCGMLTKIHPVSMNRLMELIAQESTVAGYSDSEIKEAAPRIRAKLKQLNWKEGYCDIKIASGF